MSVDVADATALDALFSSNVAKRELNTHSTISIKRCIYKAKGGSVGHVLALIEHFSALPQMHRTNALEALCSCLKVDYPCLRSFPLPAEALVSAILEIIGNLQNTSSRITSGGISIHPDWHALLSQYREDVMRWSFPAIEDCRILGRYAKGEETDMEYETFVDRRKWAEKMFMAVTNAAVAYAFLDSSASFLRDRDGATLAMRLWLTDDSWMTGISRRTRTTVADLLFTCCKGRTLEERSEFFKRFFEEGGRYQARIVDLAVSRLQSALLESDVDLLQACTNATYAAMFISPSELLSKGAVRLVTIATKRLIVASPYGQLRHLQALENYVEFGFLGFVFSRGDAVNRLIEALGAGLLTILLSNETILSKLHEEHLSTVKNMIKDTIPHFLIHRSVWTALTSAFNSVSTETLLAASTSLCTHEWVLCHVHLTRMSIFHNEIDRNFQHYGRHLYCDLCRETFAYKDLKMCANCQMEMYCSRKCQKIAWQEGGHRTTCASQREWNKLQPPLRILDRFYLVQLALHDLRRHGGFYQCPSSDEDTFNPRKSFAFPRIDYFESRTKITLQNNIYDLNRAFVEVVIPRGSFDKNALDTLRIPWNYVLNQYGYRNLAIPTFLDDARKSSFECGRPPVNFEQRSEVLDPDEIDVLVHVVMLPTDDDHVAPVLDANKHRWQEIEERTAEIRKAENWPFATYGPFAPMTGDTYPPSE